MVSVKTIGILSIQGSVVEHVKLLKTIPDVRALEVKTKEALQRVDGLIIPGGESTTIAKILHMFGLMHPLRERIQNGMPVWGTCAGMILLAKGIEGEEPHLGVMDIQVRRNAYGRQIDSFHKEAVIPQVSDSPVPLIFIRAPWIEKMGDSVECLCEVDGHIVAARENNMLVTAFHPELSENNAFHTYFANMITSVSG